VGFFRKHALLSFEALVQLVGKHVGVDASYLARRLLCRSLAPAPVEDLKLFVEYLIDADETLRTAGARSAEVRAKVHKVLESFCEEFSRAVGELQTTTGCASLTVVWDGVSTPLKGTEAEDRAGKRVKAMEAARKLYDEFVESRRRNGAGHKDTVKLRQRVTGHLLGALKITKEVRDRATAYCESLGLGAAKDCFHVVACSEADPQLVRMVLDGHISVIVGMDSDYMTYMEIFSLSPYDAVRMRASEATVVVSSDKSRRFSKFCVEDVRSAAARPPPARTPPVTPEARKAARVALKAAQVAGLHPFVKAVWHLASGCDYTTGIAGVGVGHASDYLIRHAEASTALPHGAGRVDRVIEQLLDTVILETSASGEVKFPRAATVAADKRAQWVTAFAGFLFLPVYPGTPRELDEQRRQPEGRQSAADFLSSVTDWHRFMSPAAPLTLEMLLKVTGTRMGQAAVTEAFERYTTTTRTQPAALPAGVTGVPWVPAVARVCSVRAGRSGFTALRAACGYGGQRMILYSSLLWSPQARYAGI